MPPAGVLPAATAGGSAWVLATTACHAPWCRCLPPGREVGGGCATDTFILPCYTTTDRTC